MAQRIRRNSMENLQIYDLDKPTILTSNHQAPPPLPPPRKYQCHLPPDIAFKRYQFLCDMTRHERDPIYASTPMFRTIPQSKPVQYHRRVLGSYIPSNIITPISTTSSKSAESKSTETDNEAEEEEEQENADEDDKQDSDNDDGDDDDDDDNDDEDDDDDDDDDSDGDKSSSSSSSNRDDDNMFNDDGDNQGIVEKIFNRNEK